MAKNRIKITEDGFVWKVLNPTEARMVLHSGVFQLYAIEDDDSEWEIDTNEELEEHLDHGGLVGIECGFISFKATK